MANSPEKLLRRVACATMLLVCATPLRADPVKITSGTVETETGIGAAIIEMHGADFFLKTGGDFTAPIRLCQPCPDGTVTTLDGTYSLSNRGGSLTWNGVTYQDPSFYGRGLFTTGDIVVAGSGQFTIETPFQFTGFLDVYGFGESLNPLFTLQLRGIGTALATFRELTDLGEKLHLLPSDRGLRYRFEASQVSPVPEPSSVLLIATGLAGLAVRRWRKGGQHKAEISD